MPFGEEEQAPRRRINAAMRTQSSFFIIVSVLSEKKILLSPSRFSPVMSQIDLLKPLPRISFASLTMINVSLSIDLTVLRMPEISCFLATQSRMLFS